MPTQASDTISPINYSNDAETWVIKAGVSVNTTGTSVFSNHDYSTLLNHGDVSGLTGVLLQGDFSLVDNAADGSIVATNYGVQMDGGFSDVVNAGVISARREGVILSAPGDQLINHGEVYGGEVGVRFGASGFLYNDGSIGSGDNAVVVSYALNVKVQNAGTIQAGSNAIIVLVGDTNIDLDNAGVILGFVDLVAAGASQVVNSGVIRGSVTLGAFADYFDGRAGSVTGLVAGNGGADRLIGGGADDDIRGDDGGDRLKGMAGDDTLTGGSNGDVMNGGRGDDVFAYLKITDSKTASFDLIQGWDAGDVIDLSLLDGNTGVGGQQHLTFGGAIAAGDPVATGKVQYFQQGGDTFVVADVTGDHVADFEIQIAGAFALNRGDFAL